MNNPHQPSQPVPTSPETQPNQHIINNQRGNLILIIGVIVLVAILSLGGVYMFQNTNKGPLKKEDSLVKEVKPTDKSPQQSNINKKVVFTRNGKLFSCSTDCKNPIEISTVDVKDSGSFILSPDTAKLYFIKNNNVWVSNADGSELKQITNNNYGDNELHIFILGVNKDKSKLFLSYELLVGMGDFKKNPALKYGVYYYDFVTQDLNYIRELPRRQGEYYDFVQIVGDAPVYASIFTGYYYQLDLKTGELNKFADKQFPAISDKAFINSDDGIIIYQAGYSDGGWQVWRDDSIPSSYSQILLVDYDNNRKVEISPKGVWAQYQRLIVSPDFKTVVYIDEPRKIYYSYDVITKKTSQLNINNYIFSPIWLGDGNFLYLDSKGSKPGTVYKYNLNNNSKEVFLENVETLIR